MLIAGFQKTSFVDYPGRLAAVVFTPYCNFSCTYCHNAHILAPNTPLIDEELVFEHLEKRSGVLGAVVISGGEPTLQQNLDAFLRRAKTLGYLLKLDTNGAKPGVLKTLLGEKLLDYVAMDIKAPFDRYETITRCAVDTDALFRSVTLLRNSGVAHEFRLTFAPQLTLEDAVAAARIVKGCERFCLQQYRPRSADDPKAHTPALLREAALRIEQEIGVCEVRGLGVS